MAFLGVLPEQEGFGAKLGRGLGAGLGSGLSQGIQLGAQSAAERQQKAQQQQMLASLLGLNGATGQPTEEGEGAGLELTPEKVLAISSMNPALGTTLSNLYKTQEKSRSEKKEKKEALSPAVTALEQMEGMLGKEGIGTSGALNLSGKARENRGKFSSLQAAILPLFKSMFPRGMTEKEFKFIQDNYIPQWHDTQETQKGKISGLRELFPKELSGLEMEESPVKGTKKAAEQSVSVKAPDGKIYKVPKSKVKSAMESGGVVVK